MKTFFDVVHAVNCLKNRLEEMSDSDITSGRAKLILDQLEMIELIIDRRKVGRGDK